MHTHTLLSPPALLLLEGLFCSESTALIRGDWIWFQVEAVSLSLSLPAVSPCPNHSVYPRERTVSHPLLPSMASDLLKHNSKYKNNKWFSAFWSIFLLYLDIFSVWHLKLLKRWISFFIIFNWTKRCSSKIYSIKWSRHVSGVSIFNYKEGAGRVNDNKLNLPTTYF